MAARLVYSKNLGPSTKGLQGTRKSKARSLKPRKQAVAEGGLTKKGRNASAARPKTKPDTPDVKMVVVNGRRHILQTLDARSETFGRDFGAAFGKSAKKGSTRKHAHTRPARH
jgi:hypothetical protein